MRYGHPLSPILHLLQILLLLPVTASLPTSQHPLIYNVATNHTITPSLFAELEELARIVDISYCVGMTGIQKPFQCLSHCDDFPNFELITSWNTGPLLSDSCGYMALDHHSTNPRIILAFRGTYSLANTIADLSTIPQQYVPYPPTTDPSSPTNATTCQNCTVHTGFLHSWQNTRPWILPSLDLALLSHPTYALTLTGHSLGGALALLASLDLLTSHPTHPLSVTTFGEPRVGNAAFATHVDQRFDSSEAATYRRVTHVDDPVPLLPLTEWGYRPHGGELYIEKAALSPGFEDVRWCEGDDDTSCSASGDATLAAAARDSAMRDSETATLEGRGLIPARYKLWQLFFAHRDYFWRLGVCLKSSNPWDWIGGGGGGAVPFDGRAEEVEL